MVSCSAYSMWVWFASWADVMDLICQHLQTEDIMLNKVLLNSKTSFQWGMHWHGAGLPLRSREKVDWSVTHIWDDQTPDRPSFKAVHINLRLQSVHWFCAFRSCFRGYSCSQLSLMQDFCALRGSRADFAAEKCHKWDRWCYFSCSNLARADRAIENLRRWWIGDVNNNHHRILIITVMF